MIIIGNENIQAPRFVNITTIEDIKNNTKPLDIVVFYYDVDIARYCNENDLSYAVISDSIKDAIFANALNANFIVTQQNGVEIQKIAENYMFDAKILQTISNDSEIENVALNGIDGVIYKNSIKGL